MTFDALTTAAHGHPNGTCRTWERQGNGDHLGPGHGGHALRCSIPRGASPRVIRARNIGNLLERRSRRPARALLGHPRSRARKCAIKDRLAHHRTVVHGYRTSAHNDPQRRPWSAPGTQIRARAKCRRAGVPGGNAGCPCVWQLTRAHLTAICLQRTGHDGPSSHALRLPVRDAPATRQGELHVYGWRWPTLRALRDCIAGYGRFMADFDPTRATDRRTRERRHAATGRRAGDQRRRDVVGQCVDGRTTVGTAAGDDPRPSGDAELDEGVWRGRHHRSRRGGSVAMDELTWQLSAHTGASRRGTVSAPPATTPWTSTGSAATSSAWPTCFAGGARRRGGTADRDGRMTRGLVDEDDVSFTRTRLAESTGGFVTFEVGSDGSRPRHGGTQVLDVRRYAGCASR